MKHERAARGTRGSARAPVAAFYKDENSDTDTSSESDSETESEGEKARKRAILEAMRKSNQASQKTIRARGKKQRLEAKRQEKQQQQEEQKAAVAAAAEAAAVENGQHRLLSDDDDDELFELEIGDSPRE